MRFSLPLLALLAGIAVAVAILVVSAGREPKPSVEAAPGIDAPPQSAAADPATIDAPAPATGEPGATRTGNTPVDPTGLGAHYPDPRRNTPGDVSMPLSEAEAAWGESPPQSPTASTASGRPVGTNAPGEFRPLGGGVTSIGGPDASQAAETGAPPGPGSGPAGLPPGSGYSGNTGLPPEAGSAGPAGPAPEASDPGIAYPAPEASDPGIEYPPPEANGPDQPGSAPESD